MGYRSTQWILSALGFWFDFLCFGFSVYSSTRAFDGPRAFCPHKAEAQDPYPLKAPSTKFEAKFQSVDTKPRLGNVTVR